jgi:hypothetical protein
VLRQRRITDACLNKYLPALVAPISAPDFSPDSRPIGLSIGASLHAFAEEIAEIAITLYTDRIILHAVRKS